MVGVRVIPCLLYNGRGLVKTVRFREPAYVGDATNAIRIFNDKEVDELILLDIRKTARERGPDISFIRMIASECFMPLCYGGGLRSIPQIRAVIATGVEKVSLGSMAVERPEFVREAAATFGSSAIVVTIDYKKNIWRRLVVTSRGGQRSSGFHPVEFARRMEEVGAGELVVQSIDRDGTMCGYDTELLARVTEAVRIPVIALGGAGSMDHITKAVRSAHVPAAAAGSLFVFQGRHRAVLINYPDRRQIDQLSLP